MISLLILSKDASEYTYSEKIRMIRVMLSDACLYDQLAEECSELIQAASKKSRKLRDRNPTPLSESAINDNIDEELNDIMLVLIILSLDDHFSKDRIDAKLNRWFDRLYKHVDEESC